MIDKQKRNERTYRYLKANTVELKLRFVKSTDGDILQRLDDIGKGNVSGYIKTLIRKDISGGK